MNERKKVSIFIYLFFFFYAFLILSSLSESLAIPKLMLSDFAGIQKHKNSYMEAWTYVKQSNKIY